MGQFLVVSFAIQQAGKPTVYQTVDQAIIVGIVVRIEVTQEAIVFKVGVVVKGPQEEEGIISAHRPVVFLKIVVVGQAMTC